MRLKTKLRLSAAAIGVTALLAVTPDDLRAQTAVAIDNDDIGGVVTGPSGPEAGVWVIAETTDLPTRYAKMVVTDDQGRYVVPDLPKAKYKVWVRGYGLVDSAKVDGEPGKQLNLTAVPAPNEAAAAQYYPAIHWYSMLKIPDASEFGGKSDIPDKITQSEWLSVVKNIGLHRLPSAGPAVDPHGPRGVRRVQVGRGSMAAPHQAGQAGELMTNPLAGYLGGAPYKYFGEWTDRIAKGELPPSKPTRPQGLERNVVVTTWDWGDRRSIPARPDRLGPAQPDRQRLWPALRLARIRTDVLPILDPKTHTVTDFKAPVRDPDMPESLGPGHAAVESRCRLGLLGRGEDLGQPGQQPQLHVRQEGPGVAGGGHPRPRQPRLLQEGLRPSLGQAVPDREERPPGLDARSQDDEIHLRRHLLRQPSPAVRRQGQAVDSAEPGRWPAGSTPRCSTRPAMRPSRKAGRRSCSTSTATASATNTSSPTSRSMPTRTCASCRRPGTYAVMPEPGRRLDLVHRRRVCGPPRCLRFDPDTQTGREVFNVPMPGFGIARRRHRQQGRAVGVARERPHRAASTAASARVRSTDRRRPAIIVRKAGRSTSIRGPASKASARTARRSSYYSWVDQHDTFGLGKDVPMSTANLMDGFVALKDGKMISLRVPYPMGFYAKGFDGRIDDPNAGWKGRGLWTSSGDRTPWLIEGGKGRSPWPCTSSCVPIRWRSNRITR